MHRALRQIVAVALVGIGLVLIPGRISWAQIGFGDPTTYKMTIKELCFNTTADDVFPANLCFTPSPEEFDLAAVAAGAVSGTMNFNVPPDTYKQVRGKFSCTFGLKGTVTDSSTNLQYHTTGAGGTNQTNGGTPVEGQYTLPASACDDPAADGGKGQNNGKSPAAPNNITLNLNGTVDLVANVTNGLFLLDGVLRPGNFSISIVTP